MYAQVLDLLVFVPLSDTGEPQNIATWQINSCSRGCHAIGARRQIIASDSHGSHPSAFPWLELVGEGLPVPWAESKQT